MAIATINPATGETVKSFEPLSDREIEEKIARADQAFRDCRRTTFDERALKMTRAAEILESEKRRFGELMTTEMGKPIKAAVSEAEKCVRACRYYAETAAAHLADESVETSAARSYIRYEPLGAVLAVMPWNFPFWQVFRFAAPALMAGNVGPQHEGRGEVFELAENLGVDYDRMTAVTRAAEQLTWVTTPGEIVQLTQDGREFMAGDAAARKAAVRERLSRHPLFARVLAMLREGDVGEERGVLSDEDILADLTIHFPFIPAEALFATIVEWGRDAGLLDHDAEAGQLTPLEA